MKTPREILFEKHKGAEQKLDAIREAVVSECGRPRPQQATNIPEHNQSASLGFFLRCCARGRAHSAALWQELVWPCRQVWAGLSVVWVGIIALWLTEPGKPARETVRIAPQMAAAVFVEQRRELALVLGEAGSSQPVPPPQPLLPRPHSARRPDVVAV